MMNHQLLKAYTYSFLAFCGITQLWVIYLGQQGLSLVQIGLCESIFHVASFLFEVPSGVLADRFSYRRMLALSRVAALISAAMMLVHGGFFWFALSFVVSAWSFNLQSGTLEALVYESLDEAGKKDDYAHATSVMNAVIEVTATGGMLVAGTMSAKHLAWGYGIAIVMAVLAMAFAGWMKEPASHQNREHPQTIATILHTAWHTLKNDRGLFGLMTFDALFSALSSGYFYYFQNVMQTRHFPGWLVTACLAGASLAAVIAIRIAPRLLKHAKRQLLFGLSAVLAATFLLAGFNASAVLSVVYLLNYAFSALMPPVFNVYYNERIQSEQRATLLSVGSLMYSLAMIGLFPTLGWLIGVVGFAATLAGVGGVLALGLVVGLIKMHQEVRQ